MFPIGSIDTICEQMNGKTIVSIVPVTHVMGGALMMLSFDFHSWDVVVGQYAILLSTGEDVHCHKFAYWVGCSLIKHFAGFQQNTFQLKLEFIGSCTFYRILIIFLSERIFIHFYMIMEYDSHVLLYREERGWMRYLISL